MLQPAELPGYTHLEAAGIPEMTASTRSDILTLIKRNGAQSVAALAGELKLAPITVRQHLTRLERDGLLVSEQCTGSSGRPHYAYRLTTKAHAAAFPRRTDRLIELLVREVGALDAGDLDGLSSHRKTHLLLERVARRLAAEYAPLMSSWQLPERIAFVTELMDEEGGLAEWEETATGFEIRDFNCLFHRLLGHQGDEICEWHQSFLSHTLDIEVRPVACSDTVGTCCRFSVVVGAREASASKRYGDDDCPVNGMS